MWQYKFCDHNKFWYILGWPVSLKIPYLRPWRLSLFRNFRKPCWLYSFNVRQYIKLITYVYMHTVATLYGIVLVSTIGTWSSYNVCLSYDDCTIEASMGNCLPETVVL